MNDGIYTFNFKVGEQAYLLCPKRGNLSSITAETEIKKVWITGIKISIPNYYSCDKIPTSSIPVMFTISYAETLIQGYNQDMDMVELLFKQREDAIEYRNKTARVNLLELKKKCEEGLKALDILDTADNKE